MTSGILPTNVVVSHIGLDH